MGSGARRATAQGRPYGAELIDLRAAFPRDPKALEPLLCDDGIHPSRAGQELIYRTLRARLA